MAKIFCFSTTGNSLYAAKRIAEAIGADVKPMSRGGQKCGDDVIGFVFPVYFWGLPKTVNEFMETLEIESENPYIFLVLTYGGTIHGIQGIFSKLLKKKGFELRYTYSIKCVENYSPRYEVNDLAEIHEAAEAQIKQAVADISAKKANKPDIVTFVNAIIHSTFPAKDKACDKYFSVSDNCTGCGVCADICPRSNIKIDGGRPVFLHNCEHCLACLHACKQEALNWKEATVNRQRYLNPNIKLKELVEFCGAEEKSNV